MCGRYVMARAIGDLVAESGAVEPGEDFDLRPNWNVAPTTDVAVVLERAVPASGRSAGTDDGGATGAGDGVRREGAGEDEADGVRREVHVARWGLVPPWAKDVSVGARAFNARSETVTEKPTFRAAVKARRCAVPVEGYYEWLKPEAGQKGPDGRAARKRPFYVHPADGSLIHFAGLYEWWKDESVPEGDPGRWLLSCTILTGPSPGPADVAAAEVDGVDDAGRQTLERLAGLHDRLPLPMDAGTLDAWLEPEKLPSAEAAGLLVEQVRAQAYRTASAWTLDEVGPEVGNVRNNGPELLEPPEGGGEQGTLL